MNIRSEQIGITEIKSDAVIISLYENTKSLEGAAGLLDQALKSQILELIQAGEIKGRLNETTILHTRGKIGSDRVIVAGLGDKAKFNLDRVRQIMGTAVRTLRSKGIAKIAAALPEEGDPFETARSIAEGVLYGSFRQKNLPEGNGEIQELILLESDSSQTGKITQGILEGKIIGEAVNFARNLVNEPGNRLNPETFQQVAEKAALEKSFEIQSFIGKDLLKIGARGLLAAGEGSKTAPRLIILKVKQGGEKPFIGLVGKGVTFDSGGISIKPTARMNTMKTDMAGAASVLGVIQAACDLNLPVNLIGVLPVFENMPDANAYRPGDVIEMMNGKTVEIITTDAEGRMGLADGITYAKQQGAETVIDIATLTGACIVALGENITGLMSNNQSLADQLKIAGEEAGELNWQLPLFPEFTQKIKGDVSDLKNSGGREGGTITAGAFLQEFAGETPWAHLDIAGPSFYSRETSWRDKGGTAVGLRTLFYWLKTL